MSFIYPPSLSLANIPTPIQPCEQLSAAWGGPEIYIKRDDLTGCALSGNKIRKLEFSLAEAKRLEADTLITCGGIQSNHARATAVAAAACGLRSCLVLRGDPASPVEGNLFLDRLVGAEVEFISADAYKEADRIMADLAKELEKKGRSPFIIPEGASDRIGYFGYIKAAEEIKGQVEAMDLDIDYIVVATGSGGTLGGLLLGKKLFGMKPIPIGINVCDTADHFQERIWKVIQEMIPIHGWDLEVDKVELHIIDGYVGEGYARSRPQELTLLAEVAQMEGIVLDPVYTGKAIFGLKDQIRKGFFKKEQKVLFLHSGGIFGLLPKSASFGAIWEEEKGGELGLQ